MQLPVAILMSFGALTGDIIGSFIKRRVNVKSGDPSPFMDQLGFILMALIFAYPIIQPGSPNHIANSKRASASYIY